jgi:PKHD-type hydroxylase
MLQNFDLLNIRTQFPITQVQYIPNFLHDHEINAITQIANQFSYQNAGILGQGANQNIIHRQSQIKWLQWNDENWWIYTKIMHKVNELNSSIWNFDLYGINEFIQYTEYQNIDGNRGHFDWHMDLAHFGLTSNRKLSFECVVDDNHEGGDFSVLLGPSEHKVKIRKGDAMIYPSFLLNKIYPVHSGVRKSLVSWIAGPTFK